MITCGVCPSSQCIPKSSIPNSNKIATGGSSTLHSPETIGGLVGGILGAGLILGLSGYLFIRHKNKQHINLPLTFHHDQKTASIVPEKEVSREIVPSIIPTPYVPPTNSIYSSVRSSYYSEAETPRSHVASFATFAQNRNDDDNPFNDRPISLATSFLTTTTNTDSKRGSAESFVLQNRTATTVKATQILRAKPQIMRVNTVRIQEDGLARNGSLKKTLQPENKTEVQANKLSIDDPFDDRHVVRQSTSNNTADGEITIFFQ